MGEKVTVKRECSICMKTKEVTLTADEYIMYQLYLQGLGRIQDMLPNVPPPERVIKIDGRRM